MSGVAVSARAFLIQSRPEAIESVFVLYRITGDTAYQDIAWQMFQSIDNATKTKIGNSAIDDVTKHPITLANEMESFWLAETLKYFYLMFSEPDLISLDDYVLYATSLPSFGCAMLMGPGTPKRTLSSS